MGGVWTCPVPETTFNESEGEHAIGKTYTIPDTILDKENPPTIMEARYIESIYLPCIALADFAVGVEGVVTALLRAQITLAGQTVWQGESEQLMTLISGTYYGANLLIAQSLQQPIEYKRGPALKIGGSFTFRANKGTVARLGSISTELRELEASATPKVISRVGTFTFESKDLSGHRTL